MRILFISGFANPFNIKNGFNIRSHYIANALCEIGDVDLLTFQVNIQESWTKRSKLSKIYKVRLGEFPYWNLPPFISKNIFFSKVYRLFEIILKVNPFFQINKRVASYVENIITKENYDIIVIQRLDAAAILGLLNKKNIIIDIDDHPIDSINGRYLNKFFILRILANYKISNFYDNWGKKLPVLWFSNINQANEKNSFFLPNLCPPFNEKEFFRNANNNSLLFVGSLSYEPNISGLNYFINEIWINLIKEKPNYLFYIVGGGLPDNLVKKWNAIPGIRVLGFLNDLNKVYSESTIFVSPIFEGAGTNIKILEAIKRKIPIITTKFSIRGYEDFLINNRDLFVVEQFSDFKDKIVTLLENNNLQKLFTAAAYNSLMHSNFNYFYFKSAIENSVHFLENKLKDKTSK